MSGGGSEQTPPQERSVPAAEQARASWWRRVFKRRVTYIPQMEVTECGAASLAMVLGYHGHHAPLAEVRQACGVSRDGANAKSIVQAARAYGLQAQGAKIPDLSQLTQLPLPAILHWDFNHFLVLERLTKTHAIIVDPGSGRRRYSLEEVGRRFTGVALMFQPTEAFKCRPRTRPSLARYRILLKQHLPSLGQLLVASLTLQMLGLVFPVANQLLLDRVIVPQQEAWLWGLCIGLSAALVGKALLMVVRSWVVQGLQATLDLSLMERFMGHLLKLPMGFFLQRQAGDLVQRVQSNTTLRDLFSSQSISAILDGFLLMGYAGLMLAYDLKLGLLVLFLGLIRIGVLLALKDRNQQLMSSELASAGREGGALVEALTGLETTKASGAGSRMVQRWMHRMVERVNSHLDRRRIEIASSQGMVVLQGLTLGTVFFVGGHEVLAYRMTIGVFASFITLQDLFMQPLESLLKAVNKLQFVGNHLRRLDDVLETAPEPCGVVNPGRLQGGIAFESVSFSYSPGAPPAVQNVSLTIYPGEKVALVGPTGAGKSTLARLLLGMHLPSSGSIQFDGRDLRELDLTRVRNQMGVVLQETFLFNDTVRANLSLNDPEIPLERLKWAARMACIDRVIEDLPKGYDTPVGENGSLLSGGQRQRLNLARALAHQPAVLVLDEATSSLDLDTETKVHANLASLGCTRILIAHRLATVQDADRILVVHGGQIVQEGTFENLSSQTGIFQLLVQALDGKVLAHVG